MAIIVVSKGKFSKATFLLWLGLVRQTLCCHQNSWMATFLVLMATKVTTNSQISCSEVKVMNSPLPIECVDRSSKLALNHIYRINSLIYTTIEMKPKAIFSFSHRWQTNNFQEHRDIYIECVEEYFELHLNKIKLISLYPRSSLTIEGRGREVSKTTRSKRATTSTSSGRKNGKGKGLAS